MTNIKTIELEVGLQVMNLKTPTFSELVKILNGRITRNEISKSIDRLFDIGLLKAN